jgi:hypothetical protein
MSGAARRIGYSDMCNEAQVEVLWKLIAARDKALAGAHQLSEMSLLEKEEEIHEKEEEILELKRCAEERLQVIHQLRHSYYYRLGYALLGPLVALKRIFRRE